MKPYDVYSFGMICPSRLLVLKGGLPKTDHYAEMSASYDSVGGEAANTSIVLGSLGLKVKLDGNWLSDDDRSRSTLKILRRYGIDCSRLKLRTFDGPDEVVVTSTGARTIFGKYGKLLNGRRKWNAPAAEDIRRARLLCLDPFFGKESFRAAWTARRYDVPTVTVDGKYSDPVVNFASIAIISKEFRQARYKRAPLGKLFNAYRKKAEGLIVFTSGAGRILYGRRDGPVHTFQPPTIQAVDTSGAGDSFRAGMIYGLLKGWTDEQSIEFASALAGLICRRFPGVLNGPSLREILTLLEKNKTPRH